MSSGENTTLHVLMKSLKSTFYLCLLTSLSSVVAFCGGVVTESTEASLRSALTGGGVVTFAFDGTIVLAQTLEVTNDTVLDGTGHSVALSGNDAVRVLTVPEGVSLTLSNLTITHGHDAGLDSTNGTGGLGSGGAVWVGGTLIASGCRFWTNSAWGGSGSGLFYMQGITTGKGGEATGGAICVSGGNLLASDSEFTGNTANGGPSPTNVGTGGRGSGGALFQEGGIVHLNRCQFLQNHANGGSVTTGIFGFVGVSGDARGGATCAIGGKSVFLDCAFNANSSATYEPGGQSYLTGGQVLGGAVCCVEGLVTVANSTLVSNTVTGGSSAWHTGPGKGLGGAIYSTSSLTVTNCSLVANNARPGTSSFFYREDGQGGALYNGGAATVVNTLFSSNVVTGELVAGEITGGFPSPLSEAKGGAIYNADKLVIISSTLEGNLALGAQGSISVVMSSAYIDPGADAFGGGLYNFGTVWSTNNTFANNQANGGRFELTNYYSFHGPGGNAYGGALYNSTGSVFLAFTTFSSNAAVGGRGSATNGIGFGGALAGTNGATTLDSCLVANSSSGSNSFGPLIDAGHNLSSDGSCNFSSAGSLNNTKPMLGPLGDNGGPTPTCALLPGSPAIDAGNLTSAPSTDQRGEPRPAGAAPDIGAFELGAAPLSIRGERTGNTLTLSFTAKTNRSYCLLVSTNLVTWIPVATNTPTTAGTAQFVRPITSSRGEFYRLLTP